MTDRNLFITLALAILLALGGVAATTTADEATDAAPAATPQPAETSTEEASPAEANTDETTTTLNGLSVVRDAESGALRAPNAAERKAFAADGFLKRSNAGLRGEERADGTLVLNLHGAYLSASVAKVKADGEIATDCVDTAAGYDAFFNASEEEASDER